MNEFENACDIAPDGAQARRAPEAQGRAAVGVGPWPGGPHAWPVDHRYDPELPEHGDRRNVDDRYRYWTMEAIRAAMVTDRYLPVDHPRDAAELALHCARHGLAIVGVDNVRDSIALEETILPAKACLVFGSEALGLSEEMLAACDVVVAVTQRGSTR
ncbi:hypothetical protein NOF63_10140, partial [Limosilactobacillus fermentum]|nr:hypothetical protein [Limosilactobacillus fermentum]